VGKRAGPYKIAGIALQAPGPIDSMKFLLHFDRRMHLISTKEPTIKKPEKAVLLVLTSCNNKLQLIVYLSPTFDDLLINASTFDHLLSFASGETSYL
jgi:hypothetical protein